MSTNEEVKYTFSASTDGVTDGIKKMQGSLEELGHGLHALEGAFAFEKIREGFDEILNAANKASVAQQRFANTMSSTGQAVNPDKFFEFAEALEKVSTFQADDTIMAGAMLARFKLTQDQIEGMMPSVQDLAAAMGTDLAGAADQVGKAVELGSQGLRALNLGFTKSQRAAFDAADQYERISMIQSRIQGTIGGTAAVMAGTAVGATKQLDNALEGLYETFGKMVDSPAAESLHAMTAVVRDLKEGFDMLSPGIKEAMGYIATGVVGIAASAAAMLALSGAVGGVMAAWPAIVKGFVALDAALAPIIIGVAAVAAGIVGVILIVGALKQAWDGDIGGMRSTISEFVTDVQAKWNDMVTALTTKWHDFIQTFKDMYIVAKGLMGGLSTDEIDVNIAKSHADDSGTGLGKALSDAASRASTLLQVGLEAGSMGLQDVVSNLATTFHVGTDALKAAAKAIGLDFDKLFSDANKTGSGLKPHAGNGGGGDATVYSLADLAAQKPFDKKNTNESHADAANMANQLGGGDSGSAAAAGFLKTMQDAFGLSTEVAIKVATLAHGNLSDMQTISESLKGDSDATAKAILDSGGGNKDAILSASAAFKGLSDDAVAAMKTAAGGSLDGMLLLAGNLKSQISDVGAATDDAMASINAYWDSVPGMLQKGLAAIQGAMASMGQQVVGSLGKAGSVIQAGIKGGEAGGPVGAVAGAALAVLMQTKAFQKIVDTLNSTLGVLVDALEPLLDCLTPLLSIVTLLAGIFKVYMVQFKPLFDIIKAITDVIAWAMKGIAGIINSVIGFFASVLDKIGDALDWLDLGGWAHDFAKSVRGSEINMNPGATSPTSSGGAGSAANGTGVIGQTGVINNTTATNNNTTATTANTASANALNKSISAAVSNVPTGWVVSAAEYAATLAGVGDGPAPGDGSSGTGSGGSTGTGTGKDPPGVTSTQPTSGGSFPTVSGSFGLSGILAGILRKGPGGGINGNEWNSGTLDNPSVYPVGPSTSASGGLGGIPPMNFLSKMGGGNTINANITASDPADLWAKLKKVAALDNFRSTGSSVASAAYPFVVPRSTAGLK